MYLSKGLHDLCFCDASCLIKLRTSWSEPSYPHRLIAGQFLFCTIKWCIVTKIQLLYPRKRFQAADSVNSVLMDTVSFPCQTLLSKHLWFGVLEWRSTCGSCQCWLPDWQDGWYDDNSTAWILVDGSNFSRGLSYWQLKTSRWEHFPILAHSPLSAQLL